MKYLGGSKQVENKEVSRKRMLENEADDGGEIKDTIFRVRSPVPVTDRYWIGRERDELEGSAGNNMGYFISFRNPSPYMPPVVATCINGRSVAPCI